MRSYKAVRGPVAGAAVMSGFFCGRDKLTVGTEPDTPESRTKLESAKKRS